MPNHRFTQRTNVPLGGGDALLLAHACVPLLFLLLLLPKTVLQTTLPTTTST